MFLLILFLLSGLRITLCLYKFLYLYRKHIIDNFNQPGENKEQIFIGHTSLPATSNFFRQFMINLCYV